MQLSFVLISVNFVLVIYRKVVSFKTNWWVEAVVVAERVKLAKC
jgi:hypothetical protein